MKSEDFFRLTLKDVIGLDEAKIDKHFKEFRKSHRKIPQVLASLDREIVDHDGVVIDDTGIPQLIENFKQNKTDFLEEFSETIVFYVMRLLDLYQQEVMIQIRFAQVCYKNYLAAKDNHEVEQIFFHIHHFLVHAANVDKLIEKIFSQPESIEAYLARKRFDLNDIDLKQFRDARNHLEHFEERLNAWLYLYLRSPILDMNVINSETKGVPEERCLRLLRFDEDVFIIFGEKFNLLNLHDQLDLLAERIGSSE